MRCVVVLEPASNPEMNVGYAVSSRAYTAVRRNRLRRLMREGFVLQRESLMDALKLRGMSASIVFVFKRQPESSIRRLKAGPVGEEIARLCGRLRDLI
jgi:ribonuclease P protein component